MAARRSVSVRIRGKEFRVLTDGDEASLQRVAGLLDETMARVERHTGAVDSLDVAMLAALNLAEAAIISAASLSTMVFSPRSLA